MSQFLVQIKLLPKKTIQGYQETLFFLLNKNDDFGNYLKEEEERSPESQKLPTHLEVYKTKIKKENEIENFKLLYRKKG